MGFPFPLNLNRFFALCDGKKELAGKVFVNTWILPPNVQQMYVTYRGEGDGFLNRCLWVWAVGEVDFVRTTPPFRMKPDCGFNNLGIQTTLPPLN